MKSMFTKMTMAAGIVLIGALLTPKANAGCANPAQPNARTNVQPQSWQGDGSLQQGSLLLISDHDVDPIVGMWQVKFIAMGNTGPDAPPDKAVIDSAIVQWHPDRTEIMNSGRPAQDGNFCLGVWENKGRSKYKLNHFALGNDTTNAPTGIGNPAGPTHITEDIVLSRDGNSYTGSFTLDAYDTAGNNVAHIIGQISATRITVNTRVSDLL
jgi:hypothetical protein